MSANKTSRGTAWIDPEDAPELTDDFFERADECIDTLVIQRGRSNAAVVDERSSTCLVSKVQG